ncbi:unnamed protein product [Durusdinium trenchii]|uniref:Uncharacterized protein n=1 Tax=Durusdinium trenchii TaxID=1381693 RepID=A0ABP0N7S4_9DINO
MPVLEKVADMVAGLKANKIHSLSDEDLYYELAYRKVDYSENRQENESKLLDALSGRINWRS